MSHGGRTHRPQIDHRACEICGGCTFRCPAAVFESLAEETGSLRGAIFSSREPGEELMPEPPCRMACPLGQDVPGYISAVAAKDLDRAASIVLETNALPSVCGRVCLASCMRACVRAGIDEGLDIRGLKKFVAEAAKKTALRVPKSKAGALAVAIVGGGPAGLAAAHRLLQHGLRPVVFESAARAGGLLISAAAPFVLPEKSVARDVARLEEAGVTFRCGVTVGRGVTLDALRRDHGAVIIATGTGSGVLPAVSGRDVPGVIDALRFAAAVRGDRDSLARGPVVVSGGGKAAVQSARSARRLGYEDVKVVHTAPLENWPCGADDLRAAEEEGVALSPLTKVVGFEGDGHLRGVGVRSVRVLSTDAVRRPQTMIAGKVETLPARLFVATEHRRMSKTARAGADFPLSPLGTFRVDDGYRLAAGVYAAGEAATGAATVVDSMATGRRAADVVAEDFKEVNER